MEDAMELLASQCCALDLRQGTRVQLSLETRGTAVSTTLLWASATGEHPVTLIWGLRFNLEESPEWKKHLVEK